MKWLRNVLFGNWRNKGVAMFFAVTIWFVAFQSEKQESFEDCTVRFQPQDPQKTIITARWTAGSPQEGGGEKRFDGKIRLKLSGPRQLIAETREQLVLTRGVLPPFVVPPGKELYYTFDEDDFEFVGRGLAIISVTPATVRITQDDLASRRIKDLDAPRRLQVSKRLEGYQFLSARVDPPEVRIEGPASILGSVDVRLNFSMEHRETNEGRVKVVPVFSDETVPELVRESVKVYPETVTVKVVTKAQVKSLALDGVRISFRVRMPGVPFKIVSDDFDPVNGTIPVELYGPQDAIERLEEEHKRSALILSVPVVRAIQPDQQSIRLFGESDLELYGFPGVQVRQHESRRNKGPWSYQILPTIEVDQP